MKFDTVAVGSAIRRLRENNQWSQEMLSGLAGIARSHLSMIETGSKQPNMETIWKIAQAFDLLPSELLAFIEEDMSTH